MFIVCTAVTLDAVLEITDPLPQVLGCDPVRCVLVTPVAGVALEIVFDVAGGTTGIVVPVKLKEFCVIKRSRLPFRRAVALGAVVGQVAMEGVLRGLVTGLAPFQRCGLEQIM